VEKGMSGARTDRPELERILADLEPGDTMMCWRLDRVGRSMIHLCKIIDDLSARGVFFRTSDGIGTEGSTGKFVLHIFAAAAELERTRLIERVRAGIAAARSRGAKFGRPIKLPADKIKEAQELMKRMNIGEAAAVLGVSRRTLQRNLRKIRDRDALIMGPPA
jgi:DNA invertase Pin-like site-specific DNA recombinase